MFSGNFIQQPMQNVRPFRWQQFVSSKFNLFKRRLLSESIATFIHQPAVLQINNS